MKTDFLKQFKFIAIEMNLSIESLELFWKCFNSPLSIHLMPPRSQSTQEEYTELLKRSGAQALIKATGEIELLQGDGLDLNDVVLFNTSGSTGKPKIIVHHKKAMLEIAKNQAHALEISSSDTTSIVLPPHHVGALMSFLRAKVTHSSICVNSYKTFSGHPEHLSLVPTQLDYLLKNGPKGWDRNLKSLLIGGAPLDKEIYRKAKELPIKIGHGMTETLAFFSLMVNFDEDTPTYKLLEGKNTKVESDNTLSIKSPLLGFVDEEGIYQESTEDFYKTSDTVQLIDQTSYKLLGRNDSIIISGGENISPKKIENAFYNLFKNEIEALKIHIVKDQKFGQVIHLFMRGPDFSSLINDDYSLSESFKANLSKSLSQHELPKKLFPLIELEGKIKYSVSDLETMSAKFLNFSTDIFYLPGFMDFGANLKNELIFENDCYTLEGANLEELASEIISKMKGRPTIYGYSQGGRVAFILARLLKQKGIFLKKLIIESAYIGILSTKEIQERLEKDRALVERFKMMKTPDDYWKFLEQWYGMDLFIGYKNTDHYLLNIKNKEQAILSLGLENFIAKIITQLKTMSPAVLDKDLMALDSPVAAQTVVFLGAQDRKYLGLYEDHFKARLNLSEVFMKGKVKVYLLTGSHIVRAQKENREIILNEMR